MDFPTELALTHAKHTARRMLARKTRYLPFIEDAEQEALVFCLRYWPKYDSTKAAVSSYLERLCVWGVGNWLQKKNPAAVVAIHRVARKRNLANGVVISCVSLSEYAADECTVDLQHAVIDTALALKKANLTAKQREVVDMFLSMPGCTYMEIANKLGVTHQAVTNHFSLIHKKLSAGR